MVEAHGVRHRCDGRGGAAGRIFPATATGRAADDSSQAHPCAVILAVPGQVEDRPGRKRGSEIGGAMCLAALASRRKTCLTGGVFSITPHIAAVLTQFALHFGSIFTGINNAGRKPPR